MALMQFDRISSTIRRLAVLGFLISGTANAEPEYGNYFCYATYATGLYIQDKRTSVTNTLPPEYQKFALTYGPVKRNQSDVAYCKDMLGRHLTSLPNPAPSLATIPNSNIGLSCLASEQISIKRDGDEWTYRGFGEHGVSFYGILPSEWIMFGGQSFSAGWQFEKGTSVSTGKCEKIETR